MKTSDTVYVIVPEDEGQVIIEALARELGVDRLNEPLSEPAIEGYIGSTLGFTFITDKHLAAKEFTTEPGEPIGLPDVTMTKQPTQYQPPVRPWLKRKKGRS